MWCKKCLLSPLLATSFLTQGFWNDSSSSENASPKAKSESNVAAILEFKAGYFFFANSKMRQIYDQGGLDLQLSSTFPIWKWLKGYLSAEYLQRHGTSLNGNQKTSIWQIPVSLGLKPVITICPEVQYYVALGPRYFYLHQHNDSTFVRKNIARNGVGGFVNTGFNFYPRKHLVIDIFGEYSYERVTVHSSQANNIYGRTIQVGGFSFGLGMGYFF